MGGEQSLAALRGRPVLLEFWTAGCVNCLHVAEELRGFEARWGGAVAVLGVHSAKFPHEAEHAALATAVDRLGLRHPVLNDADLTAWSAYTVKAWPTLVLVDPDGYVAHVATGEGHARPGAVLDTLVAAMVTATPDTPPVRTPGGDRAGDTAAGETLLRHPSAAVTTPAGTLLVADTGHHQVVELDGAHEVRRWGAGMADPFTAPSGMTVLPPEVAGRVGYDVVLADRTGHQLHGLSLANGTSRVVAGGGAPWWPGEPDAGPATTTALTSPWDVAWWPGVDGRAGPGADGRDGPGAVVVAMAGNHTLGRFDPVAGTVARLAGTGAEGLTDGALDAAFLAQPSALAVDGARLWFLDAESSALRWVQDGQVGTAVGEGLFDFGHVDGGHPGARLQHPLGLALDPAGGLLVADTYNGAVRRHDPATGLLSTVATGLEEPQAVLVHRGRTWVVHGHRVQPLDETTT